MITQHTPVPSVRNVVSLTGCFPLRKIGWSNTRKDAIELVQWKVLFVFTGRLPIFKESVHSRILSHAFYSQRVRALTHNSKHGHLRMSDITDLIIWSPYSNMVEGQEPSSSYSFVFPNNPDFGSQPVSTGLLVLFVLKRSFWWILTSNNNDVGYMISTRFLYRFGDSWRTNFKL